MKISDTVRLALGNLAQAKLRTTLTTMGVSIGIASLAGMVSLGVGLEDQLVGRIVQSGVFDAITVAPASLGRGGIGGRGLGRGGGRGGDFGGRRGGAASSSAPGPDLDDAALASIAALDHVGEAYPNVRVPVEVQFDGASEIAAVVGVPLSSRNEGAFQTMAFGEFFQNDTDHSCLLSLDFTKRLTSRDPKDVVGQDLMLGYATSSAPSAIAPLAGALGVERSEITCHVIGIVEREGGAAILGGGGVSGVMLPLRQAIALNAIAIQPAQGLLGGGASARTYTTATVRVKGAEYTQDVEDRIKAMGFTAFSVNDALQGAKRAFILLDIVLSLIGSIALAVSSLGIVNTMVMSILERTREIGIMKAIGGSDVDIRRIFLVEASVIGVAGGVAGVALGWLVGRIINFGANLYIRSQGGATGNLFSLPVWLIAGAIGFSWIVSLIAGSYPAARAARLDPIQALRHD